MKLRQILILLSVVAVVYVLYLKLGKEDIRAGEKALSFTLPSKTGSMSLEQFRGKVVLLNFWASWCPPCVAEMPSLEGLKKRMEGGNFEILAVSLDEDGWQGVDRFLKRVPLTFTILIDPRGDVAAEYDVNTLPHSFLIDREGRIVRAYMGPRDWTDPAVVSEILRYEK